MKRICLLTNGFICLHSFLYGQYTIEKAAKVITVEKYKLTQCHDTVGYCEDIPITRRKSQIVIVLFPLNGTSSSYTLYKEEDYYRYLHNERLLGLDKRSDQKFLGQGQPLTLNLTHLDDGNYIADYRTGECTARVRIRLQTRKIVN